MSKEDCFTTYLKRKKITTPTFKLVSCIDWWAKK